ncbi:hypothetical protein GGR54DRAFT_65741 [Hypoxylon sp. NC1633]|nr:hypothetical protein GGR54DRAFT_65741 [Hypoxylon sp. NC1633]
MLVLGILRRTQWIPLRRSLAHFRGAVSRNLSPKQNLQVSGLRFETTSPKPNPYASTNPPPRFAYPERLCIYHAGTGRVTFLACLKLSTIFIFVFFGFVATPIYIEQEGLSLTVLRTTLSAIVPLVFVAYTSKPFVTFAHMRPPPWARHSEATLRQWARAVPPDAELEITTMSLIAKPRLSRVRVADLRPPSAAARRWRIANLARDTAAANAARPWYMFRAVGLFNAQSNTVARVPWVWESIVGAVERGRV